MTTLTCDLQKQMAYRERCRVQTLNWAIGKSVHNRIDDECCPDFSCCKPEMFEQDQVKRWETYHREYGEYWPTLTCEHCESEIDVALDPRCVVYDPPGSTDVICEACRDLIHERWQKSALASDLAPSITRIKRGWQA